MKSLPVKLTLLAVGMFLFGYLLIPIYNTVCAALGINGKTQLVSEQVKTIQTSIFPITAEFVTHVANPGWELKAKKTRVQFNSDETVTAYFDVTNQLPVKRVGRAVPSISPVSVAPHVKKIECFCMERQEFEPLETKEVSVTFFMDSGTPIKVQEVVFGYTYFDAL